MGSPNRVNLKGVFGGRGNAATTLVSPNDGSPMRMTGGFSIGSRSPMRARLGSTMKKMALKSRVGGASGKKDLFHTVGTMTL